MMMVISLILMAALLNAKWRWAMHALVDLLLLLTLALIFCLPLSKILQSLKPMPKSLCYLVKRSYFRPLSLTPLS